MSKGRDNAAERLSDILEFIRMRKQSGMLSLERFQNNLFEEGEIMFQSGQVTYAHVGQLTGEDALNYLLDWHQVYFTFFADTPRLPASTAASTSHSVRDRVVANVNTPQAPSIPATSRPRPASTNTQGSMSAIPANISYAYTDAIAKSGGTDNTMYRPMNSNPNAPGLEWLVPQKLGIERDVLSLPLTRPQRSIYMLVDGRRNVADLARCTRKSMQEIERLLIELQDRGLIRV